ncbi:hypothetical protein FQN57_002359 [Myotisia sp. PD_48]|nr:hypothetical protein FQN57_002359 [Myotisia sp. PD_48]
MAHPRLPFLFPNLLRSVRSCEPTTYRSIRCPTRRSPAAGLHSSRSFEQDNTLRQRYGPATGGQLSPQGKQRDGASPERPQPPTDEGDNAIDTGDKARDTGLDDKSPLNKQREDAADSTREVLASLPSKELPTEKLPQNIPDPSPNDPTALIETGPNDNTSPHDLGYVYIASDSKSANENESQSSNTRGPDPDNHKFPSFPSHLSPEPIVHHFDTYTLVKKLSTSGFTEEQAVQIMKSIRGLLAGDLGKARAALLSKSNFENEVYLFRAACSELRTSIQTSRNAEIQAQRTARAQLQHELDILSQLMTQDLAGLKDDLRGMFNDQKISTRELQRTLDTAIQELNYQITVSLNSDGKSEAEGLRWVLTRRAVIAIATSAGMIILALRYHSYKIQQREQARKAAQTHPASSEVAIGDIVQVSNT